jgi:dynein heavy chain
MTERVSGMIEEISDKLADGIVDMEDLISRIEAEGGRTPYVNVFYQECKYMNALVLEIRKSLEVLNLGLLGELQMSDSMEALQTALFENKVPASWAKLAFESMRPLAGWLDNLLQRLKQLMDWQVDLMMPKVAWLSGFFNPQSFLTAILQQQARKNEWPLDKVVVATEVTKKAPEEVDQPTKEGSYICGLTMEGARWDTGAASVSSSMPKEMFFTMPVLLAKAIPADKAEFKDTYMCPVYKTQVRGYTFVFRANLKTRSHHHTWILAGVGMLMDVVL